jgi:methylglutaconyl-CoA hydratase
MSSCFEEIYHFPLPVIALVHGNIMGGGMGFICASDIVVAEDTSTFAMPEVQIGMAPAVISTYVLNRLQPSVAKNLMFTGKKISSKEALEINLIDFVGTKEEIEQHSEFILNKINQASPLAIKETKALINKIYNLPVSAEVINLTAATFSKMRNNQDFAEGTKALFEKRKPNWKN